MQYISVEVCITCQYKYALRLSTKVPHVLHNISQYKFTICLSTSVQYMMYDTSQWSCKARLVGTVSGPQALTQCTQRNTPWASQF